MVTLLGIEDSGKSVFIVRRSKQRQKERAVKEPLGGKNIHIEWKCNYILDCIQRTSEYAHMVRRSILTFCQVTGAASQNKEGNTMFCRGSKHKKSKHYNDICAGSSLAFDSVLSSETCHEYKVKGREAWQRTWDIMHTEAGWKHVRGSDLGMGIVHYHHYPDLGRIFKLEGIIHMTPEKLFKEIVINVEQNPKWNPTVLESKIVDKVDDETDVCHNISAEAAGGLVAKRDFVSVRHWQTKDEIIISASCGVQHPMYPPNKHYVRGANKLVGWIFAPHSSDPNLCQFSWLMATDIKGWLPQTVIDRAIPSMLLDFFRHLKTHVENDFIITPSNDWKL